MIISRAVCESFEEPEYWLRTGYTYSGHPTTSAAAVRNIEIIEEQGLLERALHVGQRIEEGLDALIADGLVVSRRGTAALQAAELGRSALEVRDEMRRRGVIVRAIETALGALSDTGDHRRRDRPGLRRHGSRPAGGSRAGCRVKAEPSLDVVGVGNAIVDVIASVPESFIRQHGLDKGSMTLIDAERALSLYAAMPAGVEVSGGSAANTMAGVASFGGAAAFIGKVGADQMGEVFVHDIRAVGVDFDVPAASSGPPTARCLIQVTPDAEKTMNTCLGISAFLEPEDIDADTVASARITYCEGYLWDVEVAKRAIRVAIAAARDAGRVVSLTLSDSWCVERHRGEWLDLIDDCVDIVFANEAEACSLLLSRRPRISLRPDGVDDAHSGGHTRREGCSGGVGRRSREHVGCPRAPCGGPHRRRRPLRCWLHVGFEPGRPAEPAAPTSQRRLRAR